ncbi:ATP-dependent Clp protease ATP-binding subunit ClpA, partial [Vibrio harveyi]
MVLPKLLVQAK